MLDSHKTYNACNNNDNNNILSLRGKIALAQAISPIPTHFSVVWSVVCLLSVVCHIRATCSTNLHALWQLHLRGPMTLLMIHQGPAPITDFTFYRITSVTCCCYHYTIMLFIVPVRRAVRLWQLEVKSKHIVSVTAA